MRMIFEMQYRRKEKFIYRRDEICSIFRSDDIEQIIEKKTNRRKKQETRKLENQTKRKKNQKTQRKSR